MTNEFIFLIILFGRIVAADALIERSRVRMVIVNSYLAEEATKTRSGPAASEFAA